MAGFVDRMIRAARLDPTVYEEVEADRGATSQALLVVVLTSLAGGVGAAGAAGKMGIVAGAAGAIVGWFVWAFVILIVGTKLLATPDTRADLGELLRTLGFASTPGFIRVLGIIPGLNPVANLVAAVWMLASTVVAVRQALDYPTTGRAIAVCLVGWIAQMAVVALTLGLLAKTGAGG